MKVSVDARPLRLVIREIGVTAASPLEARRLADTLPAALERAFAPPPTQGPRDVAPPRRVAGRVAARIADLVAERLRARP
jgi:hypothetical protein